jgi:spoIIIJ-associated protein
MEWIETTAPSVDEAKEIALDQLGVDEEDIEFEVLEEPKAGMFGRTKGEARVRARVRPMTPRSKGDRERRGRGGRDGAKSAPKNDRNAGRGRDRDRGRSEAPKRERPERSEPKEKVDVDPAVVTQSAVEFLTGLAQAFGASPRISTSVEDDEIEVRIDGDDLGLMVGPGGATLMAIQDITRVASQRRLGDQDTRLRIDIGGYRERRREALSRFAMKVALEVKEMGSARMLEPMNSADRKIVHDALVDVEGISTRSEGEDPRRRVVVEPD